MAKDVAPDLNRAIESNFERRLENDRTVQRILKRVQQGKATQADVSAYAARVGRASSGAMRDVLIAENLPEGKLYWNIAERTILPQLEKDHQLVLEAGQAVQKNINKASGLGVKIPSTKLDPERARGIMNLACAEGANLDSVLGEPVITLARAAYDNFQEANVQQMQALGVEVIVNRVYDGVGLHDGKDACQWCLERAGTYEGYESQAFERHDGCGCTVEVIYKNGTIMDPWTKAEYKERTAEARAAAIEAKQQEYLDRAQNTSSRVHDREVYIREQMIQGKTVNSAIRSYYRG